MVPLETAFVGAEPLRSSHNVWVERHPAQIKRVVGFDNLTANMSALARGTVSALIAQHPDEQVAMAIQALFDYIVLGKKPMRRDNYMHMDILTRYNIEYY